MRTTLTLDDRLANALQELAHDNRQPFKTVVDQILRLGLRALENPRPVKPYRLTPAAMGRLRGGVDLDKALALAEGLEDAAISMKLEMRK